jgi:Nucleotidyl transferase AbiEii toxin, Type IV TA system
VRTVAAADGGPPIDVVVDFLMPREVDIVKNSPPLVSDFAAQKADGAELATNFYQFVAIEGSMPDGGRNRVEIAVCSIPALLAMKGHALQNRLKQKDAYDIYYCVRNFEGGPDALAEACRPLLAHDSAARGYGFIAEKFDRADGFGPDRVRRFVQDTDALGDRTADQWQQDAFGQVDAWLRALGLRK